MTSAIETIAAWSHSTSAFSPLARRRAIDAIADTIGCMVAGVDDFSTQAVRRAVATQISISGESPVIGGGRAPAAILAMGTPRCRSRRSNVIGGIPRPEARSTERREAGREVFG